MHVIFRAQPRTELSKFINAYKSASSRLLKKEYPEIRKKHREPAEGLRLRSVTVSMKCCKCGRIKKELRLSERVYHCECGNEMDRDRNAAINIREEAKRMLTA